MTIREFLRENRVVFDGGTGTLLQAAGLPLGELPERWSLTHPEVIEEIHLGYFNAGSNIVCANTFGANCLKFDDEELKNVVAAAVDNAKRARERSEGRQEKFIALDIGPCGKLLKPYGDLEFEEAVELFAKTVRIGVEQGVDLIYIETMGDSYEAKAATLAAKENSTLPVVVSCAYGEDGKLLTGATPTAMVTLLEGLRVDGIGVNCSLGPKQTAAVVEELLAVSSLPILVKPNAGLPTAEGSYDITEEEFAEEVAAFAKMGARMVGGCCGTNPRSIRLLAEKVKDIPLQSIENKGVARVSSYTHAVDFSTPVIVGERINPTGRKRFRQALREGEVGYILAEGVAQEEKGAHILDVNVGAPEIDEKQELPRYIQELQAILDLPLQIDTGDLVAMEKGMRVYNGKPLVNSVNGKKESMDGVFPLVQKYGGVVVALTLDEGGIPSTLEGRVAIAEKILAEAEKYGIPSSDILVDPLAMAVSADNGAAAVTLGAVEALSRRGIKTSLGVSNISFGLPERDVVNGVFFAEALSKGLTAAIINPHSATMMKTYYTHLLLAGKDLHCGNYLDFIAKNPAPTEATKESVRTVVNGASPLQNAIVKGLKGEAERLTEALLSSRSAMELIDGEIVPALDTVGRAYEQKQAFLPQLLVSAEATKGAFEVIRLRMRADEQVKKGRVLLATVQGDIHDIGKNIVGSLLENYGYAVLDLGRDVPPERVVERAIEQGISLVGLSALMTTTLPSMERTVALLKERAPEIKTVVGGAVVTEEYARRIGADCYAKDAMATVRFAEEVFTK